jgi:hypothetical protein
MITVQFPRTAASIVRMCFLVALLVTCGPPDAEDPKPERFMPSRQAPTGAKTLQLIR